ncbi:acyl-CoA dehydratase activase [Calderihabitans maritimus]|uniref:CoA-substrate-specific enzyme activase n=1 Tax=Calderihabitans maritimus TaxID=1246530 RepID=A0A1Z5HPB3_9FIRM|nr:acyl-CoA dehydratase activase [Calderihabitans maritimus]GAW91359.1 CoA-substrate-specific enzyme activase [Calderihabitans maritimus]
MKVYLGIDVGSVSTNLVAMSENGEIRENIYLRTQGQPIVTVTRGLKMIEESLGSSCKVKGVGTTGSARYLTAAIVGADAVKNEITAHAVAASYLVPGVQTVLEIGGQDSKIIILRNGVVVDFAMNTVCAAGTGSFLDQQAARLNIPIEKFGELALKARTPVRIAGRCSVFAESDMIHKQQMGHRLEDIIAGLCEALVRNYLNNVGKGKEILPPVVFQGGVAANAGMRQAFAKALETDIIVPRYYNVMGAVGAALLAKEAVQKSGKTKFYGFELTNFTYDASSFECKGCANLCEVIEIRREEEVLARWGDRCGKWSNILSSTATG